MQPCPSQIKYTNPPVILNTCVTEVVVSNKTWYVLLHSTARSTWANMAVVVITISLFKSVCKTPYMFPGAAAMRHTHTFQIWSLYTTSTIVWSVESTGWPILVANYSTTNLAVGNTMYTECCWAAACWLLRSSTCHLGRTDLPESWRTCGHVSHVEIGHPHPSSCAIASPAHVAVRFSYVGTQSTNPVVPWSTLRLTLCDLFAGWGWVLITSNRKLTLPSWWIVCCIYHLANVVGYLAHTFFNFYVRIAKTMLLSWQNIQFWSTLTYLPCRLVFLVAMSSLISCFIWVSSSLICCSTDLTSPENYYQIKNNLKTVWTNIRICWCSKIWFSTKIFYGTRMLAHVIQIDLLRFSIGFCLRMRMVEFCQESISLLTAAVSCLLLASCSLRVSNSFRFTHCAVSSVGEKFNFQLTLSI